MPAPVDNTKETAVKVPFHYMFGDELVSLHVNQYACNGRLYVGMDCWSEYGPEPFADMTVNIPSQPLAENGAFLDGNLGTDLVKFIRENHLGEILPYTVQSGYGQYRAVIFDMDRLAEFDREGVEKIRKAQDRSSQSKKKANKERESGR